MATISTNLNLELQAPGERASLTVLNANLGKIDEFAGKKSQSLLSTVANVSSLESALASFGANMGSETREIAITFSAASGLFSATKYVGTIVRMFSDATRYRVTLQENNSNKVIDGVYNGTAWTWSQLALNSQVSTKPKFQYKGIQGSATETFDVVVGSLIFISRLSVSLYALYMIDLAGSITLIAGNNPTTTLTIPSSGVLSVQNTSSAGCACMVISPV